MNPGIEFVIGQAVTYPGAKGRDGDELIVCHHSIRRHNVRQVLVRWGGHVPFYLDAGALRPAQEEKR